MVSPFPITGSSDLALLFRFPDDVRFPDDPIWAFLDALWEPDPLRANRGLCGPWENLHHIPSTNKDVQAVQGLSLTYPPTSTLLINGDCTSPTDAALGISRALT